MKRHVLASLSLLMLPAVSGCLLETAVGPGAVSSDPPGVRTRPATPAAARLRRATASRRSDSVVDAPIGMSAPAPSPSTPQPTAAAPPGQPSGAAETKVADHEPTINMTSGAPWQLEPETDASWAGSLPRRPGPRAISREKPICDAAHNHCLHSNTWFVSNMPDAPVSQVEVAFRFDGRFWRWKDTHQVGPYDPRYGTFVAYRTVPATVRNARPGAIIVDHRNGDNAENHDPRFSNDARASENWHIGRIAEVNAADGTFRFIEGKRFHPLAHARVAIETLSLR